MRKQLLASIFMSRSLLALSLMCAYLLPNRASGLEPGDIAIIGYHSNGVTSSNSEGDAFAWVPLVDLQAGEILYFSDTGYYETAVGTNNGFGGSGGGTDGLVEFIVPLGGIPFGAVQTIGNPINPTPSPYTQPNNAYLDASVNLASSIINLSGSGDQLVAFQDDDISNTNGFEPLFAVNGASSSWSSGTASDRNQTNLYPGLVDGLNAIAVGQGPGSQQPYDNARYSGITTGTRSELLAEITNVANWDRTNGISETGNVLPWITNDVSQFSDSTVQPSQLKVLMIGNSYTQGNSSAPATYNYLQGLFDANPSFDVEIVIEAFSGASLSQHANTASDAVSELVNSAGEYDFVILQERSDRPGRASKFGGSELVELNNGAPVLIEDYIKANQPQAGVILFNSWARHPTLEPPSEDDLATYFNNNPVQMQTFTNLGYEHILTNSPEGDLSDVASIADIGNAWREWYSTYGYADTSALLHDLDGTHQNDLGAYLAAAVLYEKISGESVINNNYVGNVLGAFNGEPIVKLLQQQAALFGSVSLPGDYNEDGLVDSADYSVWRDNLGEPSGALPNDLDGGIISEAHFNTWKQYYGMSLSTNFSSESSSVPEPTGLFFGIVLLMRLIIVRQTPSRVTSSR